MDRAINDATLVKVGDIFQYYIALRDCFMMKSGDKLQIETNGDVSIIAKLSKNSFQREVKHHFGEKSLSDRDVDFWKTLSNWYVEYSRIASFSNLILYTTATISEDSPFYNWGEKEPKDKITILQAIGKITKTKEEMFRKYYNKIFADDIYDGKKLLDILSRFTIEHSQNQISGISKEFSSYVGHIPENNRDKYIAALLGQIVAIIKDPPHRWEVSRAEFDKMLQQESPAYSNTKEIPLPNDFSEAKFPEDKARKYEQKKFVAAIRSIAYEMQIPYAVSDYWKAEMTVMRYFINDDECRFAMNVLTHTDFIIFNKLDKMPVLVVEVDGYAFHANNAKQIERDKMKDAILQKYGIPIIRIKTNESGEENKLRQKLADIMKLKN